MDDLDRLITQLPDHEAPPLLAQRICANFRQRHMVIFHLRVSVSLLLISLGVFLTAPLFVNQGLPVGMTTSGLQMAASIWVTFWNLQSFIHGVETLFSSLQTQLTGFFGVTGWLGLAFLTIGALAGIGSLIQPHE